MKVREPVERPLDVVAAELVLTASQAYVTGILAYLAVGLWADSGVGFGPVALILGVLGLAVGAAWLFWLLGGSGWPLVAAETPVAMFAGFTLVLGTRGDALIRLEPLPLLLLVAASIYGLVAGVFLDSPRRWRWDQRRTLRPGTRVPRVSPTTKALVAKVPRSLATRRTDSTPGWPEPPSVRTTAEAGPTSSTPGGSDRDEERVAHEPSRSPAPLDPRADVAPDVDDDAPGRAGAARTPARVAIEPGPAERETREPEVREPAPTAPTPLPWSVPRDRDDGGPIDLPTSVEPRAQRSPWAWAAPPAWNRDEDDETGPPPERTG